MLGADEHEVLSTRTHAKALVGPALALIGTGALVGAGTAVVPSDYRPLGQLVVLALGAALAGWACVRPFLRWWATTYSLTNRRLVMRTGVLTKVSVDLPLWRVTDVTTLRATAPLAPPPFALELLRNEADVSLIGLVPETGGRATLSPRLEQSRARLRKQRREAEQPTICPTCFMAIPPTGVCDNCG